MLNITNTSPLLLLNTSLLLPLNTSLPPEHQSSPPEHQSLSSSGQWQSILVNYMSRADWLNKNQCKTKH